VCYWLVISAPFTVRISKSCGKEFGSSHCLKLIMFSFSVRIMVSVKVEQCVNVKFFEKLVKSATETYDLLKIVYGDECLCGTVWYCIVCLVLYGTAVSVWYCMVLQCLSGTVWYCSISLVLYGTAVSVSYSMVLQCLSGTVWYCSVCIVLYGTAVSVW
jgi:hypothetical protein